MRSTTLQGWNSPLRRAAEKQEERIRFVVHAINRPPLRGLPSKPIAVHNSVSLFRDALYLRGWAANGPRPRDAETFYGLP